MPSADEVLIAAIGLVLTGAELREAGRLAERASAGDGVRGVAVPAFSVMASRAGISRNGPREQGGSSLVFCGASGVLQCKLIFYMTSRFGCGGGPAVERRSGE
jgi:hypothetical protein